MLTGIRLRYDETEDRIVLKTTRVEGGIEAELSLLITRRACIRWRADMRAMTETAQREPQSVFKQPGASLRKTPGPAEANPGTQPAVADDRPDGIQPPASGAQLLVSAVECARRRTDGRWLIKFRIKDQPMLTLVLTDDSLQRTATGLDKLLPKCDWAMPPMKAAPITKTSSNPGSLH